MTRSKATDRKILVPERSLRFESLEGRALLSADLVIDLSGGQTAPSDVGPPAVIARAAVPGGAGSLAPVDSVSNNASPVELPPSSGSPSAEGVRASHEVSAVDSFRFQANPELGGLVEIGDFEVRFLPRGSGNDLNLDLNLDNADRYEFDLSVFSVIAELAADSIPVEATVASTTEDDSDALEGGLIEVEATELPDVKIAERLVLSPIKVEPIMGHVREMEVASSEGHDAADFPPQTLIGVHRPQRGSVDVDVALVGSEPDVFGFAPESADRVTTDRLVESSIVPQRRFEDRGGFPTGRSFPVRETFPIPSYQPTESRDRIHSTGGSDTRWPDPGPNLSEVYRENRAAPDGRPVSGDRLHSSLSDSVSFGDQHRQDWVRPSVWLGAELGSILVHASAAVSMPRPSVWGTGVLTVGAVMVSASYHFNLDPSRRYSAGDIPRQRRKALLNDEGDS